MAVDRREESRRDAQFRVMCILQTQPNISQREIAAAVGVSNGGVHYLLSALVERGLVKLENFSASKDRRRYAYILTPSGLAEKAAITREFLMRKRAEFEALRLEIEALEGDASGSSAPQAGAPRQAQSRQRTGAQAAAIAADSSATVRSP